MHNSVSYKKGFKYLVILTSLWLLTELLFGFVVESEIEELIIKILIVGIPLIFNFFSQSWSKWTSSILLVLNGMLTFFGGLEIGSYSLLVIGVYNFGFSLTLHFSTELRKYFKRGRKFESLSEPRKSLIDNPDFKFPYLLNRYKAALIDVLILFVAFAAIMLVIQNPDLRPYAFIFYVIIAISYEPIMISFFSGTIGHSIMRIEIKNIDDIEKNISVIEAILRGVTKLLLGWVSFVTINFNPEHRAIHDFIGNSVAIEK